jgi:hypothetical protein
MYYTELRIQNEAYQHRVDSAWEQRDHAQNMARFTDLSLHSNPIQQSLDARNLVGKVQGDFILQEAQQ